MALSHGKTNLSYKDKIITAEFKGSFNAESIQEYACKLKAIITSFNGKAFAMIIDNNELEGGTPDAFDELELINAWVNKSQLNAKAFILKSETQKEIMLKRTPSLSLQNIAFFENNEDAHLWLKKFL